MRVALVFPPYHHKKFSENVSVVDNEFGKYPPLNLAYVAGLIERAGHKVILVDANALNLSKSETLGVVKKFSPDVMGFMLSTYMFHETLSWIRYLKGGLGVPVIVGGINMWIYPYETMQHKEIDYGIIGSALHSLPNLLNALERNNTPSDIKGACYKEKSKVVINKPDTFCESLDDLPFPARHLLPNDKYYSFISKRKNFTTMLTSKGCSFKCSFCAIASIPYSVRSYESIIKEIEHCYNKYDVREIDFFDACFTLDRSNKIKLLQEIIDRKLDIDWSCRTRVDVVDDKLLQIMAKSGCKRIYYGIESANPAVLSNLNKQIAVSRVRKSIELTKKHGIKSLGFFMLGSPGESMESIKETIRLSRQLDLDYVQFMKTIPKPASALSSSVRDKTNYDYWRMFVLGEAKEEPIAQPDVALSDSQIKLMVRRAYLEFYLRPSYVFKTLFQIRSVGEFSRYLKGGFKMLLSADKI